MADLKVGRIEQLTHTPGPWKLHLLAPKYVAVHAEGLPPVVAWPGFDDSSVSLQRHEANARLIAAAPDLLAALKGLLAHIESWKVVETADGDIARSRAAIQKAEAP